MQERCSPGMIFGWLWNPSLGMDSLAEVLRLLMDDCFHRLPRDKIKGLETIVRVLCVHFFVRALFPVIRSLPLVSFDLFKLFKHREESKGPLDLMFLGYLYSSRDLARLVEVIWAYRRPRVDMALGRKSVHRIEHRTVVRR
jgi:hypothetical protein